nr:immunoglobulin heavy chain junction region [Macaca mulatta]
CGRLSKATGRFDSW